MFSARSIPVHEDLASDQRGATLATNRRRALLHDRLFSGGQSPPLKVVQIMPRLLAVLVANECRVVNIVPIVHDTVEPLVLGLPVDRDCDANQIATSARGRLRCRDDLAALFHITETIQTMSAPFRL